MMMPGCSRRRAAPVGVSKPGSGRAGAVESPGQLDHGGSAVLQRGEDALALQIGGLGDDHRKLEFGEVGDQLVVGHHRVEGDQTAVGHDRCDQRRELRRAVAQHDADAAADAQPGVAQRAIDRIDDHAQLPPTVPTLLVFQRVRRRIDRQHAANHTRRLSTSDRLHRLFRASPDRRDRGGRATSCPWFRPGIASGNRYNSICCEHPRQQKRLGCKTVDNTLPGAGFGG